MKWAKNAAAWTEMVRLFLDPPSLFHHLHGLDWYRGALLASLPCTPSDLAGKSFLEIGCAAGDLCTDVAAMGAHVCGLDRSLEMVQRAKLAQSSIRFDVGDALALPYGDSCFDVVYAASLLNVVSNPVLALRQMMRVCRTSGVLAILLPVAEFSTAEARHWVAHQRFSAREAAAYMAWHRLAKKVPADQLKIWFHDAGLVNARIETRILLGGLVKVIHVYPNG